ncbi:unnamed protein product [Nezara viridula]|uniref:Neuropeptide n=1 Tax=Nezara viridula TaxID=85310 RepID=A0A9P0HH37_NEZVI|nr:unnamed protein product [Nezara viridula]
MYVLVGVAVWVAPCSTDGGESWVKFPQVVLAWPVGTVVSGGDGVGGDDCGGSHGQAGGEEELQKKDDPAGFSSSSQRPGQFSSGCKRTLQSSSLPRTGPDFNPLDYRLWSELERMACHRAYPNLEILKKPLFFLAFCLAVASAALIAPYALGGDDGSYWPGKYDLRELHPDLPSVPGALPYPLVRSYWL